MKPLEPMRGTEPWWPAELGDPASSGAQDGLRYALFPERQRLAIERDGKVDLFNTGGHAIGGVQQGGSDRDPVFTTANGSVAVSQLHPAD